MREQVPGGGGSVACMAPRIGASKPPGRNAILLMAHTPCQACIVQHGVVKRASRWSLPIHRQICAGPKTACGRIAFMHSFVRLMRCP